MFQELLRPLTVTAYFLTAFLCGVNAFRADKSMRGTWIGIALLLALLGIGKQWNLLPEWVTSIRDAAWLQGWYNLRRIFQTIFVAVVLLFLAVWFVAILWNSSWQLWLPISAITLLVALSVVRAVSLHAVDMFLYREWSPGVRFNWVLELGGILVLCLSAIVALFFPKPVRTKSNKTL